MEIETWYEVQNSYKGDNYWVKESNKTYDTAEGAKQRIKDILSKPYVGLGWSNFEFRVVKIQHMEEVIP